MKAACSFVFSLITTVLSSQTYQPFIQYGAYRDILSSPGELALCTYSSGNRFWFNGDTVVAGQTYHLLWIAPILGSPNAPDFCPPYQVDTSDRILFALMREDTTTRQVFQYNSDLQAEFLLYDFSLGPGDSVEVGYPAYKIYVEDTSSVLWSDGSVRHTWTINTVFASTTTWIESLGNTNGLWDPAMGLCLCPYAVCYQQNGQNLYGDVCATAVDVAAPLRTQQRIRLSPNPADESFSISSGELPFNRITVADQYGRIILIENLDIPAPNHVLATASLADGIYWISLWQNGAPLGMERLVVAR